jgi:hypothetical protein
MLTPGTSAGPTSTGIPPRRRSQSRRLRRSARTAGTSRTPPLCGRFLSLKSRLCPRVGATRQRLTVDTTGITLTCSATSDGGITVMSRTIRIDRTAPTTSANPFALPRFERLAQPLVDCHVHGHQREVRDQVCSAPAADLLGSGHRQRLGQRFVPRPCGKQRGELVPLSYDATAPQVTGASPACPRTRTAGTTTRSPLAAARASPTRDSRTEWTTGTLGGSSFTITRGQR